MEQDKNLMVSDQKKVEDKNLVQLGKKRVVRRKRLPKKQVDRGSARIPKEYQFRPGQQFESDAEMERKKTYTKPEQE